MADARDLLAVALGAALGLFCLFFPRAVLRVQTVGRVPGNRRGRYGEEGDYPARWVWVVRLAGVVCLLVAATVAIGL